MSDNTIVPDRKRLKLRQWAALSGIILATLGFAGWALVSSFTPKGGPRQVVEKPVTHKIQAPAPADPRDVWIGKTEQELLAMRQDAKNSNDELKTLKSELAALKKQQKEEAERTAKRPPPDSALPPRPGDTTTPALLPPPPGGAAPATTLNASLRGPNQKEAAPPPANIAEITIPLPETPAEEQAPTYRTVDNYIPAGSLGKSLLIVGLDAPTGGQSQRDPVPFMVKLRDNGRLPNGFRSRVKHCHVVLAGYGDISSERVYARTETLSCILKDGRIVETPLKGYIVGEDGKAGMRGRLVSKQGALIARSLLAGIAGGIGEGIAQSYETTSTSALGSVTTVDNNRILEQGLAEGASTALDRISRWYLERADETYPVIEVDAARVADIALTAGAYIGEDALDRPAEGARRPLVTDEERRKAATVERHPWQQ